MRALKVFLTGFFPFLFVNGALAVVAPPLPALTLLLCGGYASTRLRRERGAVPSRAAAFLYYAYFAVLLVFLFFLFRLSVYHYPAVLLPALAVCAAAWAAKKLRPETAAGALLNIATFCVFLLFLPPHFSPELPAMIDAEKYVKPVFLFMGDTANPDADAFRVYDGVRRIVSNADETTLYFTAKGGDSEKSDRKFYSLHSIDMRETGRRPPVRWSSSRIYDIELTPGEKRLLALDFDNSRLLELDPATLEPLGSHPTNPYPLFILVDRILDRVFVTHEGNGTIIEYGLPDLEQRQKQLAFASPIAIAVDWNSGEMYSSNWMFPYMLSEIDMHRLQKLRVKYPLVFVGGGVALDRRRRRVYASSFLSGKITAIDRDTFDTVDVIRAQPGLRPVLVDDERKLIYVGSMIGSRLMVYDFRHRRAGSVFIGRNCRALYLTPATGRLLAGTSLGVLEIDVDRLVGDARK